ncbi:hypothetical protein BJY00DRAFT_310299 [Aspergillus carlsbadensis]|nr:hypothetical protein BJY00DRAFT_310299 [Aspergillus carlsbadensis]
MSYTSPKPLFWSDRDTARLVDLRKEHPDRPWDQFCAVFYPGYPTAYVQRRFDQARQKQEGPMSPAPPVHTRDSYPAARREDSSQNGDGSQSRKRRMSNAEAEDKAGAQRASSVRDVEMADQRSTETTGKGVRSDRDVYPSKRSKPDTPMEGDASEDGPIRNNIYKKQLDSRVQQSSLPPQKPSKMTGTSSPLVQPSNGAQKPPGTAHIIDLSEAEPLLPPSALPLEKSIGNTAHKTPKRSSQTYKLKPSRPLPPKTSGHNKGLRASNHCDPSKTVAEPARSTNAPNLSAVPANADPVSDHRQTASANPNASNSLRLPEVIPVLPSGDQRSHGETAAAHQKIQSMVVPRVPHRSQSQQQQQQQSLAASTSEKEDKAEHREGTEKPDKEAPPSVTSLGMPEKEPKDTSSTVMQVSQNDAADSGHSAEALSLPLKDPQSAKSDATPEIPAGCSTESISPPPRLSDCPAHEARLSTSPKLSTPTQTLPRLTASDADKHYHNGIESIQYGISQLSRYYTAMTEQQEGEIKRLREENKSLCAHVQELSSKNHALEAQLAARLEEFDNLNESWEEFIRLAHNVRKSFGKSSSPKPSESPPSSRD